MIDPTTHTAARLMIAYTKNRCCLGTRLKEPAFLTVRLATEQAAEHLIRPSVIRYNTLLARYSYQIVSIRPLHMLTAKRELTWHAFWTLLTDTISADLPRPLLHAISTTRDCVKPTTWSTVSSSHDGLGVPGQKNHGSHQERVAPWVS